MMCLRLGVWVWCMVFVCAGPSLGLLHQKMAHGHIHAGSTAVAATGQWGIQKQYVEHTGDECSFCRFMAVHHLSPYVVAENPTVVNEPVSVRLFASVAMHAEGTYAAPVSNKGPPRAGKS